MTPRSLLWWGSRPPPRSSAYPLPLLRSRGATPVAPPVSVLTRRLWFRLPLLARQLCPDGTRTAVRLDSLCAQPGHLPAPLTLSLCSSASGALAPLPSDLLRALCPDGARVGWPASSSHSAISSLAQDPGAFPPGTSARDLSRSSCVRCRAFRALGGNTHVSTPVVHELRFPSVIGLLARTVAPGRPLVIRFLR